MSMLDDVTNKNIWMMGAVIVIVSIIPAYEAGTGQVLVQSLGFVQKTGKNLPNIENSKPTNNTNLNNNTSSKQDAEDQTKNGYEFEYDNSNDSAVAIQYTGKGGNLNIPAYTKHEGKVYKIVEIGDGFTDPNSTNITSLTLPNTIVKIGALSFQYLNVEILNIPDSVKELGESTFSSASKLRQVNLGKGLQKMGDEVFSEAPNLKQVSVPQGVSTLDNSVFDKGVKVTHNGKEYTSLGVDEMDTPLY